MLVEATDEIFEKLIAGDMLPGLAVAEGGLASADILQMLRGVAAEVRAAFAPAAFLMVEMGEAVGMLSLLHAPTEEGVVDIGYGVAESRRGRGMGRRAVWELLMWARERNGLVAVTAETAVANVVSQLVLERNGFARVGMRTDVEDGDLICWRAELAQA
jgi:RimJ/RimL family protein N-acetyltransferase